jgi:hypothetical protein
MKNDNAIQAKIPSISVFQHALDRKYKIVPCVCTGERDRYAFWTFKWLVQVQEYFLKKIGYPFPLVFAPRRGLKPIDISIGTPISCENTTSDKLQRIFLDRVKQIGHTETQPFEIIQDKKDDIQDLF